MKKIWAIAVIAVRNAIRSKVVGVMIFLLALTIIGLPLTIKGDGSVYGQVKIMLQYTLAFITFILSVSTMWAGCAAVSLEIQDKQMHMVVTKPVSAIQIWLGKWLGLVLMNAVLLIFSGIVVYGLMMWTLRPSKMSETDREILREEILIARDMVLPNSPPVDNRAASIARARMAQGDLPPNAEYEDVYRAIRWNLVQKENSVPQNGKRVWHFPLDHSIPRIDNTLFRFRFTYPQVGADPVRGKIRVTVDKSTELLSMVSSNAPNHIHSFRLPTAIPEDAETLTIEYTNENPDPITIIFSGDRGMQMFVRRGGFMGNFTRAMALIFIQLAFIGAIGLTMGTLFSMPVAALASCYVILLFASSDYVQQNAGKGTILNFTNSDAPAWLESILHYLFIVLNVLLKPLQQQNYTELLALGSEIPLPLISTALFYKIILYSGILALFASWVFSKREIALPS